MKSEYTQGVCQDGAAILKDGQMMTIEEIAAAIGSAVGFAYAHGYHVRTKEQQP